MEIFSRRSVKQLVLVISIEITVPKDVHISAQKDYLRIIRPGIVCKCALKVTTVKLLIIHVSVSVLPDTTHNTGQDFVVLTAYKNGIGTLITLLQFVFVIVLQSLISLPIT